MPSLVFAADGYERPTWHEFIVCATCGTTKVDGVLGCPWCSTRATVADNWVSQGAIIMNIDDVVKSWFRTAEDAEALLAVHRPEQVHGSMAHSMRAGFYMDLLKALAGPDRNVPSQLFLQLHLNNWIL